MLAEEISRLLFKINAVSFKFDPPYTFTSGLKSPIYLDNRLIISYPEVRKQIIDYYVQVIKDDIGLDNVDWISGTATAAIPHAAFIANELNLPMVYVRSVAKKHGKGEQIEGYLKKESKVVVIEDHISTGKSSIDNALSIRAEGGIVEYCLATTTYETDISQQNFEKAKVKLITLTTGRLIAETAFKEGLISKKEKESVDLWFEDPPAWAGKVK
ncbi:orotate phosphoribosyltransferase [Candidatus Roizmanbacteria bacterium CG22_combo_CG10-13_8_21_14_all_38_20]|uniref:Orotate phosphoribosyltransferase n=1 Tax=Candidatus Roizmanbacteria bacterium CG22_combo_CG10-13_8_21_14_all_38_20 TaxID=1974862 RepID=A0A2H0BUL0_9BACT|nr:orotate phosphoribosyltransferase [Candidatus Microgenomates bacterium]PIP61377.1 MAG: orotate phosphoribosyltransferase [Candidatus Roizmanbacteria bacterium CG22_combo_CG10-13_8_21_14_all_38_20]PJC31488.1 MAG: orotate phosphoribosyltransferase [Candidatus Roizmanbacteria bacterium CG_4_9_14_0_2_um_filter_38_17]